MIFTECPSQKNILWCPKMNFCMILYESYKTSEEVKSLAISMLTNHQSDPWKKTYAHFKFCRKLSLQNNCIDLPCEEFFFGENVYCILYNDLASLRYGSKDVFRLSFAASCLSHSLQWHIYPAWMTRCERISNFCENCWLHSLKWHGLSRVCKRIKTNKNTGYGITTHLVWKKPIRVKVLQGDNNKPTWVIYTDIDKGYKGQWNIPPHYTKLTPRPLL